MRPSSDAKSATPVANASSAQPRPGKRKRAEGGPCGDEEREIGTLRVSQLRARLKEKGLPTKGKKAELVARLLATEERS